MGAGRVRNNQKGQEEETQFEIGVQRESPAEASVRQKNLPAIFCERNTIYHMKAYCNIIKSKKKFPLLSATCCPLSRIRRLLYFRFCLSISVMTVMTYFHLFGDVSP
jgi:hypothetical protein